MLGSAPNSWRAHPGPPAVGQEAEVANAHETLGQDMQKEAVQKLGGRESHLFLLGKTRGDPEYQLRAVAVLDRREC